VLAVVGFGLGVAFLAFVWFPHSAIEWFISSLVPGVLAFRLGQVASGYSPPPAFGIAAGVWAALFWVPIGVEIGKQVGVLT
jgi:hypothetical protein